MQLRIRNFNFEADQVRVMTESVPILDAANNLLAADTKFTVSGYILAASQAALKTSQLLLEAALRDQSPGDFVLLMNDGSYSATAIRHVDTLGGLKHFAGPKYPGMTGDWVRSRQFEFTVGAILPFYGSDSPALVSFTEKVSINGGGPLRVCRNAVNTDPQEQIVYPSQFYRATQYGEAVGFRTRPGFPDPIWPDKINGNVSIETDSGKKIGDTYKDFFISWKYEFVSSGPLAGFPHLWL